MNQSWLFASGAIFATLLAIATHVALHSPISPLPLPVASYLHYPSNNLLQDVEKLGEGRLKEPEDLCFDGEGMLYTVTRDGWIERMHRNGSWEHWVLVGGPSLLGIATSLTGAILVCDAQKGLLKVRNEEVTILASHVTNGTRIRYEDTFSSNPNLIKSFWYSVVLFALLSTCFQNTSYRSSYQG